MGQLAKHLPGWKTTYESDYENVPAFTLPAEWWKPDGEDNSAAVPFIKFPVEMIAGRHRVRQPVSLPGQIEPGGEPVTVIVHLRVDGEPRIHLNLTERGDE